MNNNDSIVLDTPEQIDMYRWLMIRRGLKMKIETGMELTRHITSLKAAQQYGFTDKKTNKAAFEQMNQMGEANGIDRIYLKGQEPA